MCFNKIASVKLYKVNTLGKFSARFINTIPGDVVMRFVTRRIIKPANITRGIYFIEVDGVMTQKVVKVR